MYITKLQLQDVSISFVPQLTMPLLTGPLRTNQFEPVIWGQPMSTRRNQNKNPVRMCSSNWSDWNHTRFTKWLILHFWRTNPRKKRWTTCAKQALSATAPVADKRLLDSEHGPQRRTELTDPHCMCFCYCSLSLSLHSFRCTYDLSPAIFPLSSFSSDNTIEKEVL